MRTPREWCEKSENPAGGKEYYCFPDVSESEYVTIWDLLLEDSLVRDRMGVWGRDALAVSLIHEVQRLTRGTCHYQPPEGFIGPLPPPPAPPSVAYSFLATSRYEMDCLELNIAKLDLELINELESHQSGSPPAGEIWGPDEEKNMKFLKRQIEGRKCQLMDRKG